MVSGSKNNPSHYIRHRIAGALILQSFSMVIFFMLTALLTGAFHCGWLCPFGFVQEQLSKLGRLLRLPRLRVPDNIERWLRLLRYLILGLSITGLGFIFFITEPYSTFTGVLTGNMKYITIPAWGLLGVFFLLSLFTERPFCRYFCAEGAKYGALSPCPGT